MVLLRIMARIEMVEALVELFGLAFEALHPAVGGLAHRHPQLDQVLRGCP
jgi:hypothetical protein